MSLKNLSVKNKVPKLFKDSLNNKKINQIYQKFKKSLNIKKDFAVAVSGGSDSFSLAFLSKIYSFEKKLRVKFFIVDHRLRPESKKEAKIVRQALNKFKIKAQILTWKGKKPGSNIQSLARKERFRLLFKKCEKYKINNILLGHHESDLVENFFIRMLRGSGLNGLVSLGKKNEIGNFNLLRPLLDQKKENLKYLSKHIFGFYIEDPSNNDEKYKRIRIRNLIDELEKEGLDRKKLLTTINNLKSSNQVISFYVDENIKKNTHFSASKNQLIINEEFFQQPYEIVFRSFSNSIKLIGNKYYYPRGKKLGKIISDIEENTLFRLTLGGCIIERVNNTILVSKEL